jgi:TP901 family phage tail tape measure protein
VATVADLFVRVSADIRGLQAGLGAAKGQIGAFGSAAQTSAKTAGSAFAGLGPVIVGAAAVGAVAATKLAIDYENAFTRISAISNSSAADIARWKGEVLELSGATAQAPQELAEALFFLSSAGLDSGQVMEALEVSAKAAASGLGSTVDVANITASALNAYAGSALTAAQVTDTLVAAVREGRAEPEAFAGALGRILPIASQAGVTFQDVTASLAGLSNVGLDVDEAVTAMRGTLQAIVAPGTQAAKAMETLGLSAQDLLDAISEDGLVGALRLLDERAKATTQTQADYIGVLRKVVPNVRALTGVLGLTGQEAEKIDAIFDNVTNSTGSLGEAFKKTTEGPGFVFRKLMNDAKIAAIQLGQRLLPVATLLAQALGPALKLVADNASLLLTVLGGFVAIKYLPALVLSLGSAFTTLFAVIAANPIGALVIGLGSLIVLLQSLETEGVGPLTGLNSELASGAITLREYAVSVKALDEGTSGIAIRTNEFRETEKRLHDELYAGTITAQQYLNSLAVLNDVRSQSVEETLDEYEAQRRAREEQERAILAVAGMATAQREGAGWAEVAADAQEHVARATGTLNEVLRGASVGLTEFSEITGSSFGDMSGDVRDAVEDVRKAVEENKNPVAVWSAFVSDKVGEAAEAFAAWRDDAAESLNFAAQVFDDVASDFQGSSDKIAQVLLDALGDQRQFARDLDTILSDGTAGAKILVQQLIDLGPAGAGAARAIASGSAEARASIEASLRKSQQFASTAAAELQTKILGTLRDIRDFFGDLTIALEKVLKIDINGDDIIGAKKKADDLTGQLEFIERHDWSASVTADTTQPRAVLNNLAQTLAGLTDNPYTVFINIKRGGDTIPTPHAGGPMHRGGPASIARHLHRMHSGGPSNLAPDELLAVLQRGEFVIRRQAAQRLGLPLLRMLNSLHAGGPAQSPRMSAPAGSGSQTDQGSRVDATEIGREFAAVAVQGLLQGLANARVQIDGRDAGRLLIPELERFKRLRDSR